MSETISHPEAAHRLWKIQENPIAPRAVLTIMKDGMIEIGPSRQELEQLVRTENSPFLPFERVALHILYLRAALDTLSKELAAHNQEYGK